MTRDPLTQPVKGDVWTDNDDGSVWTVDAVAPFSARFSTNQGAVWISNESLRKYLRSATLTTRGDSPAALIAAARDAVEAAGRAVWAEVADLLPGYALDFTNGATHDVWHVRVNTSTIDGIWYSIEIGRSNVTAISFGRVVRKATGPTPRAAVEALLAEVARG